MSKVVVVERCAYCPYLWWSKSGKICRKNYNDIESLDDIPDWCLLLDIPEPADETPYDNADEDSFIAHSYEAGFAKGWNTCLKVIERKKDEQDSCSQ